MRSLTIEVAGDDVGIVVPDGRGVRFFACDPRLARLEGRLYRDSAEAARSARAVLQGAASKPAASGAPRAGQVPSPALPGPTGEEDSARRSTSAFAAAARSGIETQLIRSDEALNRLLPEWWGLWQRAERATPFQSPAWLIPWWTSFHPGELFSVAVRRHGELIALAPLYLETGPYGRRLLPLGISVSDSLDVLVDPAWRNLGGSALLERLVQHGGLWDSLHLEELPETAEALALATPDGFHGETAFQSAHPVLPFDGREPRSLRRIEKASRRARRHGEVRIVEPVPEDVPAFVEELFRLHGAAWAARGEPGVLANEDVRAFHRAAIPRLHAAGVARLLTLTIAGGEAAILFGFVHRGRASAYLSGYDPAFAFESPGAILLDAFIRRAANEGAREFDFLRGQERYKYDWGAADRWTVRRVITSAPPSSTRATF